VDFTHGSPITTLLLMREWHACNTGGRGPAPH
jgi:hypothetical protein